jgi:glycosyltransferase involved in cell wall biosynthesis
MVSIVTVCLNAVNTIGTTVQSVLSQTYPHIEYIVVDGASTDGTLERLRSYGPAITRVISEPDTGLYNAMNKALGLATGDVIMFLNAGDRFASDNVVETIAQVFVDDPEVMLVYGDYLAWYPSDHVIPIRQPTKLTRWELWLKAVCHQTIFARREVFERVGRFDERLPVCADWDWTIRAVLVAGHKAVHVPVEVCVFRMGGVCSDRQALQRDRRELHRRYYSGRERLLFSLFECVYKIGVRLHSRDFSPPWVLRQVFGGKR